MIVAWSIWEFGQAVLFITAGIGIGLLYPAAVAIRQESVWAGRTDLVDRQNR